MSYIQAHCLLWRCSWTLGGVVRSSSAGKDSTEWRIQLHTLSISDTTAQALDIDYIVDNGAQACGPLEKYASPL